MEAVEVELGSGRVDMCLYPAKRFVDVESVSGGREVDEVYAIDR